jgi:hypothetical protein
MLRVACMGCVCICVCVCVRVCPLKMSVVVRMRLCKHLRSSGMVKADCASVAVDAAASWPEGWGRHPLSHLASETAWSTPTLEPLNHE